MRGKKGEEPLDVLSFLAVEKGVMEVEDDRLAATCVEHLVRVEVAVRGRSPFARGVGCCSRPRDLAAPGICPIHRRRMTLSS